MQQFGDLPRPYCDRKNASTVIIPVPYDGTSTWIKGADQGPRAILEASAQLELYDIETDTEVYLKGIHTDHSLEDFANPEAMVQSVEDCANPEALVQSVEDCANPEALVQSVEDCANPEAMVQSVEKRVRYWASQGKFVVVIGGEHSVSIGSIRAHHAEITGMSVLQLDAHTDLRPEYEGSLYNHACVMARASEICPVTQVGIRSMDRTEKKYLKPGRVFFQETIRQKKDWMDRVIATLNDRVYLTLDLDVLDPSIMPSTGTPEPGGMGWYELLALLRRVASEREIVGFDIVELCPNPADKAPDFLAAKLIYKILSYCYQS